ncbi:MAG: pentapeptide repeat-containing protein [Candidatus Aminicenantes bacterium]|nr:MAG: pentapeptide repeat-containing protein [Candidatus Aminicenantes bacterium]
MKATKTFKILFITTLLLIPSLTFAKSQVKASQIIDQINAGKTVQYKNAEIVGDLDFTSIKEVTLDEKSKRNRGWSKGSTLTYWCHVRSPVSFVNCVFKGDVLAYIHDEDENETYNAIFYKDVDFQGCDFQGKSAFKYVKFESDANFKNTQYLKEALFKYTKFSTDVSFSGSSFYEAANFKYTKFPTDVSFSGSSFHGDANFKYTKFPDPVYFDKTTFQRFANFKYAKFPEGVTFENTQFKGNVDFKYTKFYEPVNFDGVVFGDDVDFKYTKINGKSFVTYLLKKKMK